ncbi:MAG TPA: hypothetical protein VHQ70_09515 [Syntrophomonadaceae bacterium]|nr:hypothetical protein [Syntrophomonadaceae bacterium]
MTFRKTFCLVLLLLLVLIMGLNTSNRGISSLTLENRGPVLGVDYDRSNQQITAFVMGTRHDFKYNDLFSVSISEQISNAALYMKNYILKIWRIFYAVFLY